MKTAMGILYLAQTLLRLSILRKFNKPIELHVDCPDVQSGPKSQRQLCLALRVDVMSSRISFVF